LSAEPMLDFLRGAADKVCKRCQRQRSKCSRYLGKGKNSIMAEKEQLTTGNEGYVEHRKRVRRKTGVKPGNRRKWKKEPAGYVAR